MDGIRRRDINSAIEITALMTDTIDWKGKRTLKYTKKVFFPFAYIIQQASVFSPAVQMIRHSKKEITALTYRLPLKQ